MYIHDVGSKVKHHNPGSQCMKELAKWFILRAQISLQGSIMPMIVTNVGYILYLDAPTQRCLTSGLSFTGC